MEKPMEVTMSSDIKRLYRSRSDRIIGGVCGGLGEYLSIDPTLIRILYVLFALTGGSGIFIYLILLLIIPEEPWEKEPTADTEDEKVE
jgi:phage shock protein C